MRKLLSPSKSQTAINVGLIALALAGPLRYFWESLHWKALWFDESVQYWMSRGLHAYGPPSQAAGNLAAVLQENGTGNLDPGGFTVLLHYWLQVDQSILWQRLLPQIFFVLALTMLACLAWRWKKNWRLILLALVLPAAYPLLLRFGYEVRAYSMEFAGVVAIFLMADLLIARPNLSRCFAVGLLTGFFLSSRYSFVFVALPACLLISAHLWRETASPHRCLLQLLLLLLPPLVAGVAILHFAFGPQYHARMVGDGGSRIQYFASHLFSFDEFGSSLWRLAKNLLHPRALPLWLVLAIGLWLRRRSQGASWFPKGAGRIHYQIGLGTLLVTALLWRWHPWDMSTKWSSYLHAVSLVLALRMVVDVSNSALLTRLTGSRWEGRLQWLGPASITGFGILFLTFSWETEFQMDAIRAYLDENRPSEKQQVAVSIPAYPTVRYFYSDGPGKGADYYPEAFRTPSSGAPEPLVNGTTALLIYHSKNEQLDHLKQGAEFVENPRLPAGLLDVVWPRATR